MRSGSTTPSTTPWRAIRWVAITAVVGLLATSFASVSQASQSDRVTARTAADGANGSFTFLSGPTNVLAVALFDDSLIVGGDFDASAGRDDSGIRGWSGGGWDQLGAGLASSVVIALAVQDDTLIAAGNFTGARNSSSPGLVSGTSGIAAFAGGSWHPMGSPGPIPTIYSLAFMDDTLYAGGDFNPLGASAAYIAQWDDDTWLPLGAGVNAGTNIVLAAGDDTLYVSAPTLSAAGGLTTGRLAAWSGNAWHALSPGVDDTTSIQSMVVQDDTLYVGGTLDFPGVTPPSMRYLAARAGNAWHALGSGVNARVTALAVDDTHGLIYAGGVFPNPRAADDTLIAQAFDIGTGEWIALDDSSATSPFDFFASTTSSFAVDDSVVYIGAGNNQGRSSPGGSVVRWTWEAPTATLATTSGLVGSAVDITGWSLIGVDSVRFGSTSASTSRDDSTSLTATVPNLAPGTYTVTVSAVGGTTTAGTYTVTNPPAPVAPGAPTSVIAEAGNASAAVTWQAPADRGSYAITNYQVVASPGGRSCLTSSLSCEVTGLRNGTPYTFTVRALSGVGWGAWSSPSGEVTPTAPPRPTITITGTRERKQVSVTGSTTGFGMGAMLTAHVRVARTAPYAKGATVLVDMAGGFAWSRRLPESKTLWVYFAGGGATSNVLRMAP